MASAALQRSSEGSNVLEKYTIHTIFEGTERQNEDELQCFLVHYLKSLRSNVVLILKGLRFV